MLLIRVPNPIESMNPASLRSTTNALVGPPARFAFATASSSASWKRDAQWRSSSPETLSTGTPRISRNSAVNDGELSMLLGTFLSVLLSVTSF